MRTILLFIVGMTYFTCNAQEFVIASKVNILFVDMPNEITLAANMYKCKDLKLVSNYGKVEPTDNPCKYIVTLNRKGYTTLSLYSKRDNKLIGKQEFRIKSLPNPIMDGGGEPNYIKQSKLSIYLNENLKRLNYYGNSTTYDVKSFEVTILKCDGQQLSKKIIGPKCDEEVKKWFDELKQGDKVFFEEIEAYIDGYVRKLGSVVFNIIC
ncbi:hypothetical protein CAP35_02770 [Chitinophagaceae bacterium IBVUCB1]|nr:hypothetical protein CAP35_02770 [Chitinophagaceae bacterium IBVUCB1]